MVFQSTTYSVLFVSASEKFNSSASGLLPSTDFWPVTAAGSVAEARRKCIGGNFDLIIINSPLPDDSGLRFAEDVCAESDAAVLVLIPNGHYTEVFYRVLPSGVLVLGKPAEAQSFLHAVQSLCAVRERIRNLRRRQATVDGTIDDIRIVNRAKWALIEHEGMTEPEAHRHLTRQAMEQRISKRSLAESILRKYENKKPE